MPLALDDKCIALLQAMAAKRLNTLLRQTVDEEQLCADLTATGLWCRIGHRQC